MKPRPALAEISHRGFVAHGARTEGDKFIRRFTHMEELAAEDGVELDELSLTELDALWEAAKAMEQTKQEDN